MHRADQGEAQFPQGVVQQVAQFGGLLVRGRDHGPGELPAQAGQIGVPAQRRHARLCHEVTTRTVDDARRDQPGGQQQGYGRGT